MSRVERLVAPSLVDGDKRAVVLLTDRSLHFALAADAGSLDDLGEEDEEAIREALTGPSWSLPRESITGLRMTRGGTRITVQSSARRREIVLGEETEAGLRSLAGWLALDPVREVEASVWERLRTLVWWALLVALTGAYFLLLAQSGGTGAVSSFLRGIGPSVLSVGIVGALLLIAGWGISRVQQPLRVLLATGPVGSAERPPRIAPERVLAATAAHLRIDPVRLEAATRFGADLGLPPVEVLELVAELEEELGCEASGQSVTTFGDLVETFR